MNKERIKKIARKIISQNKEKITNPILLNQVEESKKIVKKLKSKLPQGWEAKTLDNPEKGFYGSTLIKKENTVGVFLISYMEDSKLNKYSGTLFLTKTTQGQKYPEGFFKIDTIEKALQETIPYLEKKDLEGAASRWQRRRD